MNWIKPHAIPDSAGACWFVSQRGEALCWTCDRADWSQAPRRLTCPALPLNVPTRSCRLYRMDAGLSELWNA